MELGMERLDLRHQRVNQPLAGDISHGGNVVDRLLRIELGALPARLVENVDEMCFHVEQAELEHREQAARPRADNEDVRLDGLAHSLSVITLAAMQYPPAPVWIS